MTTTIDPLSIPPSRSDPANFASRSDTFFGELPTMVTQINAVAVEINTASTSASTDASSAAISEANAAGYAAAASAASGATAWAAGTYALNVVAISQIDFQSYRKITASSMTTIDPANDSTNWVPLGFLRTVVVTGTTATAASGARYILTNVAATAVTAPSAAEGVEFEVVPANGLKTNTVDFGAGTVIGPSGSVSGVITLDIGASLRVRYVSTITKWVMI